MDNDDGTGYDDDNADDSDDDDDEGHVFENDEDRNKKKDDIVYVLWVKEQGTRFAPVHINLAKVDIRT